MLPFQNAFRSRSTQAFMRLINGGEQFDIRSRVMLREAMAAIRGRLDLPLLPEAPDKPVYLCLTEARHLDQVLQQQAAHGFGLLMVPLGPKRGFSPAINLFPVQRLEMNLPAGRQELPDLLEGKRLGSLHSHLHRPAVSPAVLPLAPLALTAFQHHLALETSTPVSIILYWKRLILYVASACVLSWRG